MNTMSSLQGFFNTSFEFFSLIVYLTIGIFLFFNIKFQEQEKENSDDLKSLIAASFIANAVILVCRQILEINHTEGFLYDYSSIMIIIQLIYPLAIYLYSVTKSNINMVSEMLHTLLPLSFFNIIASLMLHMGIIVPPLILFIYGTLIIVCLILRVSLFSFLYCKHLNRALKSPFGIKNELLRLTLLITGVTIFLSVLLNIILSPVNYLMFPSLFTLTIMSILTALKISQTEIVALPVYTKSEENITHVLTNNNSSSIDSYRHNQIKERLEEYFENGKPYLNKKLSIKEVAANLYTNKTYLSKIINDNMGVNFNQYVNFYRMKEVEHLLKEDSNMGMKELCDKAGFGCMATFAVAFRLNKGDSPAEWCKKHASYLSSQERSRTDD